MMFNISSAMAGQFAEAAREMTEHIAMLGPSPLRNVLIKSQEELNSE